MKSDPRKMKKSVRFETQPTLPLAQPSKIAKNHHLSPLTLNEKIYLRSLVIPKIVITRSGSGNFSEMDESSNLKLRKTVSLSDIKRSIDTHDLAEQLAGVGLSQYPWKKASNQTFDDNLIDTFQNIKIMKKAF
jgi:hypothetical protein